MISKVFRSGNSQAVRIPKELAFADGMQDVEIERRGEVLVIRPLRQRSLRGILDIFARFPTNFMADGRPEGEERERGDRA